MHYDEPSISLYKRRGDCVVKYLKIRYIPEIINIIDVDIQLYQHEWKVEKREIVRKHDPRSAKIGILSSSENKYFTNERSELLRYCFYHENLHWAKIRLMHKKC